MSEGASRIDFSREDEAKMASAATWGQIVAGCLIGSSLLALIVTLTAGTAAVVMALLSVAVELILGISLLLACASFRRVAHTDEDDHGHLLSGFRSLRNYFLIQGAIIITVLVLWALAVTGLMTLTLLG